MISWLAQVFLELSFRHDLSLGMYFLHPPPQSCFFLQFRQNIQFIHLLQKLLMIWSCNSLCPSLDLQRVWKVDSLLLVPMVLIIITGLQLNQLNTSLRFNGTNFNLLLSFVLAKMMPSIPSDVIHCLMTMSFWSCSKWWLLQWHRCWRINRIA